MIGQVDSEQLRRHVVRIESQDGKHILGTGVSVAPGLVLTCAHVVEGLTDVCVVALGGTPVPATVRERSADPPPGRRDLVWPFPDLAILGYDGPAIAPFALLDPRAPGQQAKCRAWGYASRREAVDPVGDPAVFRFAGTSGDNFLTLKGDIARPGLSGAPLVCPERRGVVGLVCSTRDARYPAGGWASPVGGLTHPATPPDLANAGAALLQANREAVLKDRRLWQAVIPLPGSEHLLSHPWGEYAKGRRPDPADLLLADYGVVRYLFRDQELADAQAWCLGGGPAAVAVVTADGGMGKTRFTLELAKRMVENHGWIAGERLDLTADVLELAETPLPRLVIVDYAESAPTAAVGALIEQLSVRATDLAPVRVVLVVRQRADRVNLVNSTMAAIRQTAGVRVTRLLQDHEDQSDAVRELDAHQRDELYRTAVTDFAAAWQTTEPTGDGFPGDDATRPLAVLYVALDAVLTADAPGGTFVPEPDDELWDPTLPQRVLAHEEKYWRLTAPDGDSRRLLRSCVAVATLAGAADEIEADALLRTLPDLAPTEAAARRTAVAQWLAGLYRGPAYLNPLRPDRLGEALVVVGLLREHGADALAQILRSNAIEQNARALTVLRRCLADPEAKTIVVSALTACFEDLVAQASRARATNPSADQPVSAFVRALGLLPLGLVGDAVLSGDDSDAAQGVAAAFAGLGGLLEQVYDLAAAQSAHQQAVRVFAALAKTAPEDLAAQLRLATARANLAYAYQSAGDLTRAIPLHEQTLTDREWVLGPAHPQTLTSRNNLAYAYQSAGDLTRAIPLYEQTLTDRERVLEPDHPDTLSSRNNLAYAYQSAGDLTRAIPLHEQTLTDTERVLGPDHPQTLDSRSNLAGAYESAGDLTRAVRLYEQTLTDRERVLGPAHPQTLTSRDNLAGSYASAGDLTRAIPMYEQTLTDTERVLGPAHPDTLISRNNLACAYASAGGLTRAVPLHEQTLTESERVLGPAHPQTLTSRNNLAYAYESAGDLTRAIPLHEQTLADCERVLGPDHPQTLTSRHNLGVAYARRADFGRAVRLLGHAFSDRERVLGPDHPDTRQAKANLAYVLRAASEAAT